MASLKRKLDSLKSTLPGPEDSPIPSPSEDAPSPTGSDSPFLVLGPSRAQVDPELDGKAMDDGDGPMDNRDAEDMDMSEEEGDGAAAEGWWRELLPSTLSGRDLLAFNGGFVFDSRGQERQKLQRRRQDRKAGRSVEAAHHAHQVGEEQSCSERSGGGQPGEGGSGKDQLHSELTHIRHEEHRYF